MTKHVREGEAAGAGRRRDYHEAVGALFDGQPDPLVVIKGRSSYDTIEHATMSVRRSVSVLESIRSRIPERDRLRHRDLAVAFNIRFHNGFHDSANSIATFGARES